MKLNKILLTIITLSTILFADGPLKILGFYNGMSSYEACKLLKELKDFSTYEGVEFFSAESGCALIDTKSKKSIEDRHATIHFNGNGTIREINLKSEFVNDIYKVTNDTGEAFLKFFVYTNDWIDNVSCTKDIDMTACDRRSDKYGWYINFIGTIGDDDYLKNIDIKFFEPKSNSLTGSNEGINQQQTTQVVDKFCMKKYNTLKDVVTKTKTIQEYANVEKEIYKLGYDCPGLIKQGWYPGEAEPKGTHIGVLLWHTLGHLIGMDEYKDDAKINEMYKPYGPLWEP